MSKYLIEIRIQRDDEQPMTVRTQTVGDGLAPPDMVARYFRQIAEEVLDKAIEELFPDVPTRFWRRHV